jgi:hypothetical protein
MAMTRLFKNILLVLLPVIVMLAVYLVYDPFEVIYTYRTHSLDPRINYNWDYNQTETLIRNYAERRYDSFIFGSSRALAFRCSDWKQYIDSGATLHFAAPAESLYGIYTKFKYLSAHQMPIKNCILLFDTGLLAVTWNGSGLLYLKHPKVSGGSLTDFHLTFFRAFMDHSFFLGYLSYKMTGSVPKVFSHKFAEGQYTDPVTGDKYMSAWEKQLTDNSDRFYESRKAIFYHRDETAKSYQPAVIKDVQLTYLKEIRRILAANRTNYKIIISPLYDQKYISPDDLVRLKEVFGPENVYDYSGINDITRDIHNYYETSHFRPHVARRIMAEIYSR